MYLLAESTSPPPPTQLAGFLLKEDCYFSLHGFGLPGAYKLWQVLGKLWRFLLEWFFARGLERKPHGLQERLIGMGFSSGWGRLSKVTGQAHRLPTMVLLNDKKPKLNRRGVIPGKGREASPHCLLSLV